MRILDFLLKSEYTRSIFKLTTGSVIAQGVTFLFMIVLTRIYTPSDFGIFTLYISILSFIAIVSTAKYDIAIVVAGEQKDAVTLVKVATYIAFSVAFLVFFFVTINRIVPFGVYHNHPVLNWLYLLPVSVILLSLVQILWMWNVRQKNFNVLNYSRISDAISAGFVPVVLSVLGPIGLLLGYISGQLISLIVLAKSFIKKKVLKVDNGERLLDTAKAYSEFPRVNILQSFVDTFQTMGIILIGSRFISVAEIGYYSLSLRILQAPMGLLIRPISNVFFSEASVKNRAGESLFALVKETLLKTALVALPFLIIILLAGPFLFEILFGSPWKESGIISQILVLWYFFDFLRAPVSQLGMVLGRQREILYVSLAGPIVLLLTMIVGYFFIPENTRLLFLMIAVSQSIITLFIIYKIILMSKQDSKSFS